MLTIHGNLLGTYWPLWNSWMIIKTCTKFEYSPVPFLTMNASSPILSASSFLADNIILTPQSLVEILHSTTPSHDPAFTPVVPSPPALPALILNLPAWLPQSPSPGSTLPSPPSPTPNRYLVATSHLMD